MSELRARFLAHAAGLPPPPRTHSAMMLPVAGAVLVTYLAGLAWLGITPGRDPWPAWGGWAASCC